MIKIVECRYKSPKDITLVFSDGMQSSFNLESYLHQHDGPLLRQLHNSIYAQKVFVEYGALCWPNGLELSPQRLYELTQSSEVA
ncbi:MAG: DUF2442 domain-containing protein [Nitrincola sp.]|nr:DUF2442 domain-containing protein [Nitrincola sp.]